MRLRLEHVAFFLTVFAFTCCDATPSDPTDHPGACTTLIATKGAIMNVYYTYALITIAKQFILHTTTTV